MYERRNTFVRRSAREIMVTELVTLEPETPALTGVRRLLQANVKGAPVVGPGRSYRGIFTERCCLDVLMTFSGAVRWSELMEGSAPASRDFMATTLTLLSPEMDVFEAVNLLLANRISGAPVVDDEGRFLGVFSEKSSMNVVIGAAYDRLPTTRVEAFMNTDANRTIDEDLDLQAIVQRFLDTPFRRLPVLRGDRVVGQISRHDALLAAEELVNRFAHSRPVEDEKTAASFMDTEARTIDEDYEIFSVADVFRQSDYRRLPVVREGRLVGQITRKDLLRAANELLEPAAVRKVEPLYLSSVVGARAPEV